MTKISKIENNIFFFYDFKCKFYQERRTFTMLARQSVKRGTFNWKRRLLNTIDNGRGSMLDYPVWYKTCDISIKTCS